VTRPDKGGGKGKERETDWEVRKVNITSKKNFKRKGSLKENGGPKRGGGKGGGGSLDGGIYSYVVLGGRTCNFTRGGGIAAGEGLRFL